MVHAVGVHELDSADQLEHEVTHVFGFQWTAVEPDGLVEVTVGAVLQNQIDMSIGFEGMDEVDQVGMMCEASVTLQLFEAVINGQGTRRVSGRCLGQALDGNVLTSLGVVCDKHHSEGAMVQGRQGPKPTI